MENSIKFSKLTPQKQYEKLLRAGYLTAAPGKVGTTAYYYMIYKKELPAIKID